MTLRWTTEGTFAALSGAATALVGAILHAPAAVILGATMLAAFLVDGILIRAKKTSATITVKPRRIPEGKSATVMVDAPAVDQSMQLKVLLSGPLQLQEGTNVVDLQAGSRFEVSSEVRGPHKIGPLQVRCWSPLRLWAKESVVSDSTELEVIPNATDASEILLRSRVVTPIQGRFQVNRPGHGFDFFALREYQSGDTIRSINWKATARRNELIVNQRQLESHGEISILLDARAITGLGSAGSTPLDRGCRIALGAFIHAMENRDQTHLVTYGDGVEELPSSRQGRVEQLEAMLARLPPKGRTSIVDAWATLRKNLRSSTGPAIIITSAEADQGLAQTVREMISRGHAVSVISPAPTDTSWGEQDAQQRIKNRHTALSYIRDLGASVLDWSDEKRPELSAPAPVEVLQ